MAFAFPPDRSAPMDQSPVAPLQRTTIYVDGFNLYYRAVRNTPHKWLNLMALFRDVLRPTNNITKIRYFTAMVSGKTDQGMPQRQQTYLRALATIPELEVHKGRFLVSQKWAAGVVFLIAPAGAILGIITGVIVARNVQGPGAGAFFKALAIAVLNLEFEIRMPAGRVAPDSSSHEFSLVLVSDGDSKGRVSGDIDYTQIGQSEGRVVIPGTLRLVASTRNRSLAINDSAKGYWFDLPLKAKPDSSDFAWTDWWPKPGEKASTDIRGTDGFQLRYRVAKRKLDE